MLRSSFTSTLKSYVSSAISDEGLYFVGYKVSYILVHSIIYHRVKSHQNLSGSLTVLCIQNDKENKIFFLSV